MCEIFQHTDVIDLKRNQIKFYESTTNAIGVIKLQMWSSFFGGQPKY